MTTLVRVNRRDEIDCDEVFHVGRILPPDAEEFVEVCNGSRVAGYRLHALSAEELVELIGVEQFARTQSAHPSDEDQRATDGRIDWHRKRLIRELRPFPTGESGTSIAPGEIGVIVKYDCSPPFKGFEARRIHMEGGFLLRVPHEEAEELFGMKVLRA